MGLLFLYPYAIQLPNKLSGQGDIKLSSIDAAAGNCMVEDLPIISNSFYHVFQIRLTVACFNKMWNLDLMAAQPRCHGLIRPLGVFDLLSKSGIDRLGDWVPRLLDCNKSGTTSPLISPS